MLCSIPVQIIEPVTLDNSVQIRGSGCALFATGYLKLSPPAVMFFLSCSGISRYMAGPGSHVQHRTDLTQSSACVDHWEDQQSQAHRTRTNAIHPSVPFILAHNCPLGHSRRKILSGHRLNNIGAAQEQLLLYGVETPSGPERTDYILAKGP